MNKVSSGQWTIRKLIPEDLDDCHELSTQAGWNQTRSDWEFIIGNSEAYGVQWANGRIVATSVAFSTNGTRWIAMVLVSSKCRGKGLAGALLKTLGVGEKKDGSDYLDATKFGAPLYERRGFVGIGTIYRLRGEGRKQLSNSDCPGDVLRISGSAELARLVGNWERTAAVATWCPELLDYLLSTAPEHCLAMDNESGSAAAWVRPGRLAWEIGPLVATDTTFAEQILDACLATLEGPVVIDVPGNEKSFLKILAERNFSQVREFERMCCGPELPVVDSTMTRYATAGPDFG